MLERLLDLAVYALVAALVAIGAAKILDQRRDAQTVAWTEAVTRAMDRLAGTSTGYATSAQGADMTAALTGSTLLPAAMIDRNAGAPVLRNPFGGTMTVTGFPGSFVVAQDALPPGSCIALAARARDWAQQICVNGTCAATLAAADTAWASQSCNRTSGQKNIVSITMVP